MSAGLVYYSDCRGDATILQACRDQMVRAAYHLPVELDEAVAVTLQPLHDPQWEHNIVLPLERGYLTMFRQILAGLEALTTDCAFLCEHDVLYHPSHFSFRPTRDDVFYYNQHTWRVDATTGHALFYFCSQVSGLCASRALLIEHYRKRVAVVEARGFDRRLGFEPGTNKRSLALDAHAAETWMSSGPNIDIKTTFCLTKGRWRQDQFRNPQTCLGWTESDRVPGWGITAGRFPAFLRDLDIASS